MSQPATIPVLIVDDEPAVLESLQRTLSKEGWTVRTASDGHRALDMLRNEPIGVVLSDVSMPGMTGLELLTAVKTVAPQVEVILLTAFGTVESAVAAMKDGAYDFLTKPIRRHDVVTAVRKALERRSLVAENQVLRAKLAGIHAVIGSSAAWQAVVDRVRLAAPSDATVLLQGESGTGKEVVARMVHQLSRRAGGPFVAINCAAIPETLLESELFGHERGAFTGAASRREGWIEKAHGGTLFLDEVTELSPPVQAKLLRVLQEREVVRVGGTAPVRVDTRIVSATNQDIEARLDDGTFRRDVYFRLNTITLRLPPLRRRRTDIPLLVSHFLQLYAERNHKRVTGVSRTALDLLEAYDWPGNVRELQHAIERAVVLSRAETLGPDDFEAPIRPEAGSPPPATELTLRIGQDSLADIERRVIRETLRLTGDDKNLAAQLLGISARTIYRKFDPPTGEGAEAASPDR